MARPSISLGRRNLAGGALLGLAGLAGAAAPSSSADAQLIAICAQARRRVAEYERLLTKWWTLQCGDPQLSACATEMDSPHNMLCDLAEMAQDIPASTPEGWQAKAVLIRHLMNVEHNSNGKMEFETSDQELMWSLICDMTGRA